MQVKFCQTGNTGLSVKLKEILHFFQFSTKIQAYDLISRRINQK